MHFRNNEYSVLMFSNEGSNRYSVYITACLLVEVKMNIGNMESKQIIHKSFLQVFKKRFTAAIWTDITVFYIAKIAATHLQLRSHRPI
jgi:hypothetical protein